ncbi:sugar ABC transporter substrate-binding protein [Streptomyces tubbatahanensis]|uniref:Sugar ABC transporter substrate-binding protein n=1 Tax=Streptomyces tubbatahanensis TaxID=2923272 RepID=A0ABY3Y1Y9_9ACTN|nr:sugar ABC transporter substrate-binding protein [Streptomyces tubbatahanensis]UNT00600.1 sugar ABC transporter substrate-binding protein [Streptomyces tubbatahanensis]
MLHHRAAAERAAAPPGATRRRFLAATAGAGAAAASPALLTGCGTARADTGRLRFWNFYGPQRSPDPAVNAQSQWFVDTVARWNATHKTQIDLVYLPRNTYINGFKLPSAFATGEGPDVFLLSPGDFLRYYNGGVLADLTPHMAKEAVEDFGSALDSRTVDGRVYALPMEVEPLAMFYAQDVWEKAGLSEADIPTSWDRMLDIGDKLRAKTRAGLVFETSPGYLQNFTWYPWMWQGGGEVLDESGEVAFDSKATRQALQLWQDAVRHGIAPRTPPAAGDVISGFKGGNVAMWQQGIWNVSSFSAYAPAFRYGVFKLPVPPGGRYLTALGGWSFAANAHSGNAEAAAEFCVWALGSMQDDAVDRMVDWCVGAKSDVAPRESALERGAAQGGYDSAVMRRFKDEIFPGGRAEPRYPPVVYKAISDAIQGTMLADRGVAGETERAASAIAAYTESYKGASLL